MQQRRPVGSQGEASQPLDQRMLLFMLMALSIYMLFGGFNRPPVEPAKEDQQAAAAAEDAPPAATVDAAPASDAALAEAEPAAEGQPPATPQRIALGSVDPTDGYRMMVTIDNAGAGVERVELSSDQYRDLDDRSGYLGHLALTAAPSGGSLVNVVGPGTPAAAAGLRVGDVIVGADTDGLDTAFEDFAATPAEITRLMEATKPGRVQRFIVARDGERQEITAELRRQPLSLQRPEEENIRLHTPELPLDFETRRSFLVRLRSLNGRDAEDPAVVAANERLTSETWAVDDAPPADTAVLRKRLPEIGLEFVKRFTLVTTPDAERDNETHRSYHFRIDVEIVNLGEEAKTVAYELTGPNGLPIEGHWYATKIGRSFSAYGLRDVVVRFAGDKFTQIACSEVADEDVPPMGQGKPLAFVGVDAQYFASIVIPEKPSLGEVRYSEVRAELATAALPEKARDVWENASCVLARKPATLAPGASLADGYTVFSGPKLPALLREYRVNDDPAHALDSVLYYGWFGPVARLMLGLLHLFHSLVGNYGIAIVMLTIVVRGALFPISRQQAKNMVKMQELKPEIDRIAEKYKDDMQKRSQAQQELFRKHNFNPAAGCLPMFLQLPIFLGLYRALAVDVELRQAPLISDAIRFCSNLAAPDMLLDWSAFTPLWMDNGQGILGLGPFFNLLPLFSVCLFLLQQKMFMPEPTNDQARLQQKLMKYMMIMMGFFLFKMPSGLCLYFIASSLWGMGERKLLPKATPVDPPAADSKPAKSSTKPSNNGEAARKKAKRKRAGGKKRR